MVQPSRLDGPYHEGWTLLAGLATVTERVRIDVLQRGASELIPELRG